MATVGAMEIGVTLSDNTYISFAQEKLLCYVFLRLSERLIPEIFWKKMLSISYFGYLPRGIAAASHYYVAAEW